MFCKYYYWGIITLWISPGHLWYTCDQAQLKFDGNHYGVRVYGTDRPMELNWFEAFCCCRSKGKTLVSVDNRDRLRKFREDLFLKLNFKWVDGKMSSDGIWRHAVTGKALPSELFRADQTIPPEGFCAVFDWHSASLKTAHCQQKHLQHLFCDDVQPDGDCYPTGLNPNPLEYCNKTTVIEYTKENVCPRRVVTTPAPTMPPTPSITSTMQPASSITPPTMTTRSPKVCYECSAIPCSSS